MPRPTRLIRDVFTDKFDRMIVDDADEYDQILEYVESVSPELRDRGEVMDGNRFGEVLEDIGIAPVQKKKKPEFSKPTPEPFEEG